MRRNLIAYEQHQVFLNYPFDIAFEPLERAMEFAVVAGGMLPVCAKDLTVPDRPRLEMLIDAVQYCYYSIHDFSRFMGYGRRNLARFNCPIEMGMALFHGMSTHRRNHRCAFLVASKNDYKIFASDLGGLDPLCHENDDEQMLTIVYEWLRRIVNNPMFNSVPTADVLERYRFYCERLGQLRGSARDGKPSHEEAREVMYSVCSEIGWWDWRDTRAGRQDFSPIPLSWRE